MTSTLRTAPASPWRRGALFAAGALAFVASFGCAGGYALDDESEIASTDRALIRSGGDEGWLPPDDTSGGTSSDTSYRCVNGTCTCNKAILNDCENMSAMCSSGSLDALISCIDGWATTHCTCTQAFTSTPGSPHLPPGGENKLP